MRKLQGKSKRQVPTSNDNYYARWREIHFPATALHDLTAAPSEALLQLIWLQQRLDRAALRTLDGEPLRVLHPGFVSLEGGPDFRGAVLRFGEAEAVSGDVEIDIADSGWRAHGHDRNPKFKTVILHVVWEANATPVHRKTLALRDALDAPLFALSRQLEAVSLRTLPNEFRGKCCAPLQALSDAALESLLLQAALVRLHHKASVFRSRAQLGGWEQALWEGLFRALGYRHNTWPMLHLAEQRSRWLAEKPDSLVLQARLFGLSGLLPNEVQRPRSAADKYLLSIWNIWWRERDGFTDCSLPKSLWRFHGLRPANHPHRRLALAAHWAQNPELIPHLTAWGQQRLRDKELHSSLREILETSEDSFWSWHWTLRSARLGKAQPLLGPQRITDLAVNTILPWLLARAQVGKNGALISALERRFLLWPAAEDNSVLRLTRQRLLGRSWGASRPNTAASQQGMLQIARDFCDRSTATCAGCQFPEMVKQWRTRSAT